MLASLIALLPGSASFSAWRAHRASLRGNRTHQAYRPGPVRQLMYWAALHPVIFAMGVGVVCAAAGFGVWPWVCGRLGDWASYLPGIPPNWLKSDFDVGAFIGVPWGVQATLVALVFPLVLSFVASFFQSRAKAEVILRVYLLDTGILPAGASSLALLAVLTMGYFGTPVLQAAWPQLFRPLLIATGFWFLLNIALTAWFLARTLKYLQADEQRESLWNAAVGVIFQLEIREGIKQGLIYQQLTALNDPSLRTSGRLQAIRPIGTDKDGVSAVKRNVSDGSVLAEVYVPFLKVVARSWLKRVRQGKDPEDAAMYISATLGQTYGVQRLVVIEAGPHLLWWERLLVRMAFIYDKRPSRMVSLSTSGVMAELAAASVKTAQEGNLEDAADRVRELRQLFTELLDAGRFINSDGEEDSMALLAEARYHFMARALAWGWVDAFRAISRKSIETTLVSTSFFRSVAHATPALLLGLNPPHLKLADPAMGVFAMVDRDLSEWWERQAVRDESDPAALPELSAAARPLYAELLAVMVGAWTDVRGSSRLEAEAPVEDVWREETSGARVLVMHLNESAALLSRAISRLDVLAANRYCDFFLKWLNFQIGLRDQSYLEFRSEYLKLGLGLLRQKWPDARMSLVCDKEPGNILIAKKAIDLTLKRYFEARRVMLVLGLLEAVQPTGDRWDAGPTLAMRMALALIAGQPLRRGGDVNVAPFSTMDEVLERLIHAAFVDGATGSELANVSRQAYHDRDAPDVNGWSFGGFMPKFGITAPLVGWARLLAMLIDPGRLKPETSVSSSSAMLARAFRSPGRLSEAGEFFKSVDAELANDEYKAGGTQRKIIDHLRSGLGKAALSDVELAAVREVCGALAEHAAWYRSIGIKLPPLAAELKTAYLSGFARGAFAAASDRKSAVPVVRGEVDETLICIKIRKSRVDLVDGLESAERTGFDDGRYYRPYIDARALYLVIQSSGASAIEEPDWTSDLLDEEPAATFIDRVGDAVERLRSSGKEPAVVLWSGRASFALRPDDYRERTGRGPLPSRYQVSREMVDDEEQITVNGAPVLQRQTGGRCYVVPLAEIENLVVSSGPYAGYHLAAEWHDVDDGSLTVGVEVAVKGRYGVKPI